MKLHRKRDLKRCGIYCIRNIINNKVYVGKSINIYERMRVHINYLNKKSSNENAHFINSWHKYGRNSFEYSVLEDLPRNEELIKERELYWITKFESTNPEKGYNIRMDSSTGMIISEKTRKKLSDAQLKRWSNLDNLKERKKTSIRFKKIMSNLKLRKQISESVSKAKQIYDFVQYDRNMNFIKRWKSIKEIVENYPSYKWQNIYSVCDGYKPTYMGFIWRKELKI
jgi:group I intron endonuclease